ncbi:MAG: peptidylprolyl isomerase [Treponema sp.]|nr:peptidylprolyl isomerase [Treponema sp.]
MKIAKDKWVTLHYTLTDDDGNQIDSSVGREPLGFPQGYGYLITGLENALEGRDEGEKFSVKIQPEDAYGVYDEALKMDVPRDRFDMDGEIEIGMNFQMFTPQGPAIVRVVEVGDKFIKIDANHELAGKVLNFDVEIVGVRDATEEELNPRGCGGCGGSCGDCEGGCGGGDCGDGCGNGGCGCGN